jgi:hypothetical protein
MISVESLIPNLIKRKIRIKNIEEDNEERVIVHL